MATREDIISTEVITEFEQAMSNPITAQELEEMKKF